MATIAWPATLPNPKANGFSIGCHEFGKTLSFQSGRQRVTRNRATLEEVHESGYGMKFSAQLSFQMTLSEYDIFIQFYDTNWKTIAPQYADKLAFTAGGYTILGWPTSPVATSRSVNSWEVSFGFEVSSWDHVYASFSDDETHPICPTLPSVLPIQEGCRLERITRDQFQSSKNSNLSRIPGLGDNFLQGDFDFQLAGLDSAVILIDWWSRYLKFGSIPFKFSADQYNFGQIDSVAPNEFYCGKFIGTPKFSYNGHFGTASVPVIVWIPNDEVVPYYMIAEILDSELAGSVDLEVYDAQTILDPPAEFTKYDGKGLRQ